MLTNKKFKVLLTLFCFCSAVILLSAFKAQANNFNVYNVYHDWTLYGNLNQNDIPGVGNIACGPTAAVNSFVYLENMYPKVYDHKLIPDFNNNNIYHDTPDLVAVAQTLASPAYMNMGPGGTYADNFIYGKWKYIEQNVPGKTIYKAQNSWDWTRPPVEQPDWVHQVFPSWDFLYREIRDCEDVEILINNSSDHYLTLTSIFWDETTNSGKIDYIDPWTGSYGMADIFLDLDGTAGPGPAGSLYTNYAGGESWVSMAVSESVPIPASLLLMGSGLLGLGGFRFRKKLS